MPDFSSSTVLAGVAAVLLGVYYRLTSKKAGCTSFSLHPLCPAFISGAYAAYKLGADEIAFILQLRQTYDDVVYLPYPLGNYFVLGDSVVRKIYNGTYNQQLSFDPIRKQYAALVFGTTQETLRKPGPQSVIFPQHARGLGKGRLTHAIERFCSYVDEAVEKEEARLRERTSGKDSIDLINWAFDIMLEASVDALLGTEVPIPREIIKNGYIAFDEVFPLLSSGMIPLSVQSYFKPGGIAHGIKARDDLNEAFGKWARETGCAGLEETDLLRSITAECFKLGWSDYDVGSQITSDLWAVLANNPFAACWVLVFLTQSDEKLLEDVYAEIDRIPAGVPAHQADRPLLQSVFFETLRLQTSTFSARRCMQQVAIGDNAVIAPGETVICVTRVGHLDKQVWGDDAHLWDGRRFYDDPSSIEALEKGPKASQIPFVRAFGGGVSMCEGRNLAQSETKAFLVAMLRDFRFEFTTESRAQSSKLAEYHALSGKTIAGPVIKPGRPGLGVMQFEGGMRFDISLRQDKNI